MGITLRKKVNVDGSTSLRMDIIHNGKRWNETIKALRLVKPTSPTDRQDNKDKLEQAKAIVNARLAQLEANAYGAENKQASKMYVLDWMQEYAKDYTKKDRNTINGVVRDFDNFLKEEKNTKLIFGGLTPTIIEDFIIYLQEHHTGEGITSYYNRFKKMMRYAYRKRILRENIIDFVDLKPTGTAKKRDILTIEELGLLNNTPVRSDVVKRAAFFAAATGCRYGDIKALTWENIDLTTNTLKFKQGKTGNVVEVPLNATAIKQLGEQGSAKQILFPLPSIDGTNKTLKKWVLRAGINMHVTFHNLRHSFGTNLIHSGVDVVTTSRLMGHATLRYTNRYVNTSIELKKAATDKLNF